jgi:ATP-dependent exoDNAse (exonuclease V) alpha subunit
VLGSAAEIHAGEHIQASGHWEQHREHGPQFRALFLQVTPPSSREGIERYLASGLIKGIGPHFAKRLVAAFGEAVFDVIENTPRRLLEVGGIGEVRLARITARGYGHGAEPEACGDHRRAGCRQDHHHPHDPHHLAAKGVTPLLAAPTGRAAKRLAESTAMEAGKRLFAGDGMTGRHGRSGRLRRHASRGAPPVRGVRRRL